MSKTAKKPDGRKGNGNAKKYDNAKTRCLYVDEGLWNSIRKEKTGKSRNPWIIEAIVQKKKKDGIIDDPIVDVLEVNGAGKVSKVPKKRVGKATTVKLTKESYPTSKPKTIADLKNLCPVNLKGLEKSQWIATERQKHGI